ncbi:hypothetical protein BKA70DRAFT_1471883 [Coprinopsis sp. MPI-PUGE-AT-0042]|nr:hypothetical protein BKA70DRAFT_1471883 [Coprinopsis sp. MPI-PUGE-AT-0042]
MSPLWTSVTFFLAFLHVYSLTRQQLFGPQGIAIQQRSRRCSVDVRRAASLAGTGGYVSGKKHKSLTLLAVEAT